MILTNPLVGYRSVLQDRALSFKPSCPLIAFLKNYDEIVWPVTGADWVIPIEAASIEFIFPKFLLPQSLITSGYTYKRDLKDSRQENVTIDAKKEGAHPTVQYTVKTPLPPFHGFIVRAGWPKGFVVDPAEPKKLPPNQKRTKIGNPV